MACASTLLKHPLGLGLGVSLGLDHGWSIIQYPITSRVPQTNTLKFREPKKFVLPSTSISHSIVESLVDEFDPSVPVEEASTPPSSRYTDPTFYSLELDCVFYQGWQAVGYTSQIKDAHDYFTGRLGNVEYVVCRDGDGKIHAFHNVCRHRASVVASGSGKKSCFICPYHGWTYDLDGALLKATRIIGIQNFDPKVFCDNYLDEGYHVPYAHKGYASEINYESYSTDIVDKVIIQRCASSSTNPADGFDRLGSGALYAFVYPNLIFERYGPWMSTNPILPLGPRKCQVIFDFFLDEFLKDDKAFIDRSIKVSHQTQMEDVMLCESVQRGLESPAYSSGRYVPALEKPVHHFHCLLYNSLTGQTA